MRTKDALFGDYQIPMYLALAAFFFAGMLTLVGGITFFTGVDSPIGGMCLFAIVVLVIIGSVLLVIGLRLRGKQRHLEKVADLLKAYRRISISKLAAKLGVSEMDAEYTIADCLGNGLVEGYIDRRSGEFFTKEALYQVMNLDRCPICSAPSEELYLQGEEIRCRYCGTVGGVAIDRDGDGRLDKPPRRQFIKS